MNDVMKIMVQAGVLDNALLVLMRRWGVEVPDDMSGAYTRASEFLDELRVAVDRVTDGGVPEDGAPAPRDAMEALNVLSQAINATLDKDLLASLEGGLDVLRARAHLKATALRVRGIGCVS